MLLLKEIYFGDFLFEDDESEQIKIWPLEEVLKLYNFENTHDYNDSTFDFFYPTSRNKITKLLKIRKAPIVVKKFFKPWNSVEGQQTCQLTAYGLPNFDNVVFIRYFDLNSEDTKRQLQDFYEKLHEELKVWYKETYIPEVNFLNNIRNKKNKNPESVKKSFGNFFGGEQRKLPTDSPEVNTETEHELIKKIIDHINDADLALDKNKAKEIKYLLKKNAYTDIFIKPSTTFIYRGMGVGFQTLKRLLNGFDEETFKTGIPKKGSINPRQKLIYKPKDLHGNLSRGSSSWSSELDAAKKFAKVSKNDFKNIRVVLVAKTNENPNKLFDLKNFYNEFNMGAYAPEKEVVGLGDIVVDKIMWEIV